VSAAALLDTLLEASVRATLIAACVGLTLVVFRVKSGATRHAAWTAVLVTMLTWPLVSGWLPTVPVPGWMPDVAPRAWMGSLGESSSPESAEPMPIVAQAASGPVARTTAVTPRAANPSTAAPVERHNLVTSTPSSFTSQHWLLLVWLTVAAVLLLREAIGWWAAHRLVRRSVSASSGVGTSNNDAVVESDLVTTPLVVGLRAPRVLVPASFSRWGADMQRMVVLHERAHVSRFDPLVATVARINRAVFWFHPLSWWLERHLARVAEHPCDEVVVRPISHPRP